MWNYVISKALEAYIAATNTHDFDNVALDVEAIGFRTGAVIRWMRFGPISNMLGMLFRMRCTGRREWIASDAHAVSVYTYHFEGYHQGTFMYPEATNVFVRHADGIWKLKHEHLSSIR